VSDSIPAALRRSVVRRARSLCEYCLVHQEDTHFTFQIDHIISRKHRGATLTSNLALACLRCNVAKGTDVGAFAGRPRKFVRLHHPREDAWADHSQLAGARIAPLSEIGSATARLLDLNAGDRLLLRRTLIKAGRYPSPQALKYLHG